MARPVEYDLQNVLDNAMEIFWKKGFEGVSMAQLVDETGLNRRTMYSLFNDKEGLFRDALDNYYSKRSSQKLSILKEHSGKNGLILLLRSFTFGKDFKGCLFSNTMREKDFVDERTYDIPKEYFDSLKKQIQVNLTQAKKDREFTGNVEAMALTIITMIHGFHVHGKYNNSKEDSRLIIENVINMIS
jgi:TetR/AcrR family transcriptional repressor of nem operon